MSRYNIEKGFISKLIETEDMKIVKDMQIKESFFTGDNRRVFSYIQSTWNETGDFPTVRVLGQKFPSFHPETYVTENGEETVGTEESLTFWGKEVRQKTRHNLLAESTEKVATLLDNGETDKAQEEWNKTFFKIDDDIEVRDSSDLTQNIEDRKRRYKERQKNKGMIGIPTGIDQLDYILKGLIDDTLTGVIARTGTGKTWFLVIICSYAMLMGYKVCMFITEMNREQMEDRFDACLFGMMYEGFSYEKFKRGALDSETEQAYYSFLEEDVTRLESLIIESVSSVSGMIGTVRREKPDLIAVDSAYLMDDDLGADSDWLRVAHITRSMKKNVAKAFHKPVIFNSQADKSTSKKTGPEIENISFTQAIGQDCDNIIGLYRDEVMINDHEMGAKVAKNREGTLGTAVITWDFQHMKFNGIYGNFDSQDANAEFDNSADMSDNILSVDD